MKKSMDMIVHTNFAPHKPHADMEMLGYRFLCAHISVQRFSEDDLELETDTNEVYAVPQEQGVNFYTKGRSS